MLFNRLVRRNFHREMRENRESLYGLLFLVRTLPVVRGSWNLKGVSVVNRGKKKGVSLVVKKRVWREGERSWEGKKSLLRGEESL